MSLRRRRSDVILLPGETGRRSFLKKLLFLGVVAGGGGVTWLGTRSTRVRDRLDGLTVFTAAEATVLLALADRLVPPREGFPRPRDLQLAARMDAIAALADPATQTELRRVVRLFENAFTGLLLDGTPQLFTEASPARQDRRIAAWAGSRLGLRRTGHRALKRLVYAAYYGARPAWPSIGYPTPPFAGRTARARGGARG